LKTVDTVIYVFIEKVTHIAEELTTKKPPV